MFPLAKTHRSPIYNLRLQKLRYFEKKTKTFKETKLDSIIEI